MPQIAFLSLYVLLILLAASTVGLVALARRRWVQGPMARDQISYEELRQKWDGSISEALIAHHRVTVSMLEEVPAHLRTMTMRRYVDSHKDKDLLFGADPPVIEPVRALALQRFANSWVALLERIASPESAGPMAARLVEQLCDLLGFTPLESRIYHLFPGYLVQAPTVRLSIPRRFPIIFLLKPRLTPGDLRDLRDLMHVLGATSFFAILVVVGDESLNRSDVESLNSSIRRGAEDFIVLAYRDLVELFMAADPTRHLMELILAQVDLTVVSPYVTWGPVSENMFFGRDYELKAILRTIRDRSFAIVGGRKIGKTSVLTQVQRLMDQTTTDAPIYLDCQHVTNYTEFFEALAIKSQIEIGSNAPDVLRRVAVRLRVRQPNRNVVMLLDEVDQLLHYDEGNQCRLFKVFRALSQEGLCRFVLCGERRLNNALHDPGSPLFNFCNIMPLGHLLPQDVRRIVLGPMATMGVILENPEALVEEIIELSSCHPNIVQAFCQMLIVHINERGDRSIKMQDVADVRSSEQFLDFFFEVIWGNATGLERLITVIEAGERCFSSEDVIRNLREQGCDIPAVEVQEALKMLALFSILKKDKQCWTFAAHSLPRLMNEANLVAVFRQGLVDALAAERAR